MMIRWMAILAFGLLAARASAQEATPLKTEKDKISYGVGVGVARNFKRQGIDNEIELELMIKGMRDSLSGGNLLMSEEELEKTMSAFQKQVSEKQAAIAKVTGERNKKEGEAFLEENEKKEGVTTLPSGLQYKILKAGEGKKPTIEDTVVCNYRGTFIDGTEFDSSYKRNQPATFAVKGVIRGWTEALQLMPVGSKWQLFVPSNLAYGTQGALPGIGPNAVLIFEVEMLAIK